MWSLGRSYFLAVKIRFCFKPIHESGKPLDMIKFKKQEFSTGNSGVQRRYIDPSKRQKESKYQEPREASGLLERMLRFLLDIAK
ncbi:MAG: hypothetical protein DWH73_01845 [Planctomycetota bacterium]|nr:MAG: hypothetical protein DWH73_01845 [Planctomycetota bacterium]